MAFICAAVLPAMAPATSPKISAPIWPTRKPTNGVDAATSSPGAWSAEGPTAYRGRGRRPPPRRRGRWDRRPGGRVPRWEWRCRGVTRGAGRPGRPGAGRSRWRRCLLDPFAGHVPVRDGPRAGGRAGPVGLEAARRAPNRSSSRRYRCPQGPRPAGDPAPVTPAGRSPPCRGGA